MRMKRISQWVFAAAVIVAGVPAVANATITQVFSSRADFLAATSGLTSLSFDLGAAYTAPSYTVGSLTVTAPGANVYGTGSLVSTDLDSNSLLLTFATPVTALGLYGGVTDEFLGYVNGTLSVSVNGGAATSLTANGGSAAYLGLISDVAISEVELSIVSFDVSATSTAFVTLEHKADLARARDIGGGVPEPATWMMMIVGFGCVGGVLRRKTLPARNIGTMRKFGVGRATGT